MTNQEAINIIQTRLNTYYCTDEDLKALDLAIKALEDRPTGEWERIDGYGGLYICTNCGENTTETVMGKPRFNFCPNCGRRMKK